MNWLFRFFLGLPCRQEDLVEIKKNFPEFLDSRLDAISIKRFSAIYFPIDYIDIGALKKWCGRSAENQSVGSVDQMSCIQEGCPLRSGSANKKSEKETSAETPEDSILNLMAAGGGPRREPLKNFLDIVRKVHKGAATPKAVYLTDPFLISDVGEQGNLGGHDSLVEYLKCLNLNANDSFAVFHSGSLKGGQSLDIWQAYIRTHFKNIGFRNFPNKYTFHDRFYIVDHGKGDIRGTFGPSMNGLTANSIVLLGEIEKNSNGLNLLAQWLGI